MAVLTETTAQQTYDLWASCYDKTFGVLISNRHRCAIEHLRAEPGERVLDIGVGTGMTLQHYPRGVTVVGLDLSAAMLTRADEKRRVYGLEDCHLVRADAMKLPFEDGCFDHIVITHTISVVSDPARLIYEAMRLLKPGGRVVVMNHFLSSVPWVAWAEKVMNPLFMRMGWRSDLNAEALIRETRVSVDYRFKTRSVDFWQILVLSHGDSKAADASSRGLHRPSRTTRDNREDRVVADNPSGIVPGGRLALGLGR